LQTPSEYHATGCNFRFHVAETYYTRIVDDLYP
jgi:hypothetical protein